MDFYLFIDNKFIYMCSTYNLWYKIEKVKAVKGMNVKDVFRLPFRFIKPETFI